MEYSSNSKGNLGVALGAVGTGLSILSGGAGLLGSTATVSSNYVSKDEMKMIQDLAAKDSQIALLTAEQDSEVKMTEVYKQSHEELVSLRTEINSTMKEMQSEINQNRREQDAWNASQSVANAQVSAAIATNANSIASIQNLIGQITMTKVPNSAVCPGWGSVSITPTASGTTIS